MPISNELIERLGISNFLGPLISGAGNDENRLFYRECLCVWVIFEHIARFLITSPNSRQSFPALSNVTHSRYLPGVRDSLLHGRCRQRPAERHFCPAQQAGKRVCIQ
ncbi:hypothetical protein [Symbiopectobacterium purcellii]|uniref:hypothetical protein n=1 Tax=Symbiopectobacterium purcellii TaxID=2871826 RepID=UPI003F83477A